MAAGSVFAPVVVPLRHVNADIRNTKGILDDRTPIELYSETKCSTVYYTINGEKPDPFQKLGRKSTFKFSKPFTLPAGKRFVKAIAVSQQDRTSAIVTKVFQVHRAPVAVPAPSPPPSETLSLGDDNLTVLSSSEADLERDFTATCPAGTQLLRSTAADGQASCLQCKLLLPADKTVQFCPRCGFDRPGLPLTREAAVSPSTFAYCRQCHALVPRRVPCCPSCHAHMGGLGGLASIRAQQDLRVEPEEGLSCDYCGTTNSPDHRMCVTCERDLTPLQTFPPRKKGYPLVWFGTDEYHSLCSSCGRINSRDAHFCDWCGTQGGSSAAVLSCRVCSGENQWQAQVCQACGAPLQPRIKPALVDRQSKFKTTDSVEGMVWYPVIEGAVEAGEEEPPVPTSARGTQTEGIFYRSSQTIQQATSRTARRLQEEEEHRFVGSAHQRRPSLPLVEYSPGTGYWRQQVDHVAQHLKVHAANSPLFRDSLASQQMGKLVSAEALDGDGVLRLTVQFELKPTSQVGLSLSQSTGAASSSAVPLSTSASTQGGLKGSSGLGGLGGLVTRAVNAEKAKKAFKPQPTKQKVEDYLLTEEVSGKGKGRPNIVTQLIEQGGSVNSTDSSGCPLLCLAARHCRTEALKVIIDYGAVLNTTTKRGNTALHEAVLQDGRDCAELLLRSGIDVTLANKAGETATELAQGQGRKEMVRLIASHVGSSALRHLLK